jgi:hypothetical protein
MYYIYEKVKNVDPLIDVVTGYGQGKGFYLLQRIQIDSRAQPDSCTMGTRVGIRGEKWQRYDGGHSHIVPRSGMVELYYHSPIRLHRVALNFLIN